MELVITLIILTLVLWFWALIDIAKTRRQNPSEMSSWFLLIIALPLVGSILYFQLKGRNSKVSTRKFQPKFH
ncbi:MAG: PLDc_N domain-containing protein [Cytophagia bacterium]|nr:PLDc_N domain-containing protein [Cytophagia bacterium]